MVSFDILSHGMLQVLRHLGRVADVRGGKHRALVLLKPWVIQKKVVLLCILLLEVIINAKRSIFIQSKCLCVQICSLFSYGMSHICKSYDYTQSWSSQNWFLNTVHLCYWRLISIIVIMVVRILSFLCLVGTQKVSLLSPVLRCQYEEHINEGWIRLLW